MMKKFKYSIGNLQNLKQNGQHNFAMNHSMRIYQSNALYSCIPKNGCSTLRLSVAITNGCIDGIEQGHWIHANNHTFNASLAEAIKVEYTFVVLRCPFRRLASVFLDKFVSKKPDAWQFRNILKRSFELDNLTFREFVSLIKDNKMLLHNIHWRPQVSFLIYKNYSDYFCLEEFPKAVEILKSKIGFDVVDARKLTNHGTDSYKMLNDKCYADTMAFDIAVMKRDTLCPSHASLYDD
ncbi:MAG TPA: hypothetical protein ENK66_07045, partial [Arcobacter sp.]|nr:hypothetical protein [Arcobacter sp.]